jgi:transcriptional regulator GlxA family with amidase domain
MNEKPAKVIRVAILAVPGVQMLDLVGPMDVFSEANNHIGDAPKYELDVVGITMDPVKAVNGMRFAPDVSIEGPVKEYHTVLVAGSPSIHLYETNKDLIKWLLDRSHHAQRVGSICSGAFLLAHAGLLNGRRATTHWNSTARLAKLFPKVKVDPDPIYLKDGPIYTTAGVTAGIDVTLALVEEDHGRAVALRIAKQFILFLKRPGGQAQFSMHLAAQIAESGPMRDIQQWIVDNPEKDLGVEALAQRLGMSTRNFARLFKKESQITPAEYVETVRVDAARRLLQDSATPLKVVATKVGFSDQSGLRRAFMRQLNVTPAAYRESFPPAAKRKVIPRPAK